MALNAKIREISELASDRQSFRPRLLQLSSSGDRAALEELIESGGVAGAHDILLDQLRELLATRLAGRRLSSEELGERVHAHLAGTPLVEYGTWVHYPWSRRLVHVLPESEYRELRSSRNRYKISPAEQSRLLGVKIGIIGLSVGLASAITLVLESIGREFRLADFDELALSNMNRLRTAVYNVGTNKCIIAAREMVEIDPYIKIEIFERGLGEDTVEAFLAGGGRLDLLVEECDDLFMKLLVREHARAHKIPVIMETNERGMLDIERFDLEPDRPVLHGLLSGVRAAQVKGLDVMEKVPHVLRIIGLETMSTRMRASMFEIGQTLTSWPQLASGVSLGGALTTDAARKIILGKFQSSGRFFADLDLLIRDDAEVDLSPNRAFDKAIKRSGEVPLDLPSLTRAGRVVTGEDIRRVVAHGILAPSRGNAQPWKFTARLPQLGRPGRLRCFVDREPTFLDFDGSLSHVALGAAVENMDLAARAMGLEVSVRPFPSAEESNLVCEMLFTAGNEEAPPPLAEQITARVTNRRLGPPSPLAGAHRDALSSEVSAAGAKLLWVTTPGALEELGSVIGAGERLAWLLKPSHEELMSELRWSQESVEATRDGLDVATLEMISVELFMLRLRASWAAMEVLGDVDGGRALEGRSRQAIRSAAGVGLVTIRGTGRASYFQGGRAIQRMWLAATAMGLAIHPMSELTSLFAQLERGQGRGLDDGAIRALRDLRARYRGLLDVTSGESEVMLFRVHHAEPVSARSLRRPVDQVLAFEDARGKRLRTARPGS